MARPLSAAQKQRLLRRFADEINAGWHLWTDDVGTLVPLIEEIWPRDHWDPHFEKIDDVCAFVSANPVGYAAFPSKKELLTRLEREERGVAAKERAERNDLAVRSLCNVVGILFALVLLAGIGALILGIYKNSGLP